jgi:dUTP pyrophosphatase
MNGIMLEETANRINEVYDVISDRPKIDMRKLARAVDISRTQLYFYVNKLIEESRIKKTFTYTGKRGRCTTLLEPNRLRIKIQLMKNGIMPKKAHPTDACYDVYVARFVKSFEKLANAVAETNHLVDIGVREFTIMPGNRLFCSVGFATEIPRGYLVMAAPRSGIARDFGITFVNSPGIIDEDFRGEWGVTIINHGNAPYTVKIGDRAFQFLLMPREDTYLEESKELNSTERGADGFGSSGR